MGKSSKRSRNEGIDYYRQAPRWFPPLGHGAVGFQGDQHPVRAGLPERTRRRLPSGRHAIRNLLLPARLVSPRLHADRSLGRAAQKIHRLPKQGRPRVAHQLRQGRYPLVGCRVVGRDVHRRDVGRGKTHPHGPRTPARHFAEQPHLRARRFRHARATPRFFPRLAPVGVLHLPHEQLELQRRRAEIPRPTHPNARRQRLLRWQPPALLGSPVERRVRTQRESPPAGSRRVAQGKRPRHLLHARRSVEVVVLGRIDTPRQNRLAPCRQRRENRTPRPARSHSSLRAAAEW